MDDDELTSLPSGLRQSLNSFIYRAVRGVLIEYVQDQDMFGLVELRTAFDQCKTRLDIVTEQAVRFETGMNVYRELAELWHEKHDKLEEQITYLQSEIKSLKLAMENNNE